MKLIDKGNLYVNSSGYVISKGKKFYGKIPPQQVLINFMKLKREYLHQIPHPHDKEYVSDDVLDTIYNWSNEDCESIFNMLHGQYGFNTSTCVFCLKHFNISKNCNSCEYKNKYGICNCLKNDNMFFYWFVLYNGNNICITQKLTNKWLKMAKKM